MRKLAIYWGASCGGCEISVLGIHERILELVEHFEIVFCPCIVDGKREDVESWPDGSIDVTLFNGSVRTSEQEEMARLLRRKSRLLVGYGSCAIAGCIPGLANLSDREGVFDTVYRDTPSTHNPDGVRPQTRTEVAPGVVLELPEFYDRVIPLGEVVEVDAWLPGCPPESDRFWEALQAILAGELPPKGAVIGAPSTVCDECPRVRGEKRIRAFRRIWEVLVDDDTCLLEQGIVCAGVATRGGCGALCPEVRSPCIGCHGTPEGAHDQGSALMSALASVIDSDDPEEIERIVREGIPDPVGTFYRFGLAGSPLGGASR